jgi:hypothetical protein
MTATYTKLRNGDWGLRLLGDGAVPGTTVTVTRKDGSTRTEQVGKLLWVGDGAALATIARSAHSDSTGKGRRCVECGRPCHDECQGCGSPLHPQCSDGPGILCQGCAP